MTSRRVLTVPNLISFTRLLGVPLFLYLFLVPHAYAAAVVVLVVGGTSDWVDGYLARRLRQGSLTSEPPIKSATRSGRPARRSFP